MVYECFWVEGVGVSRFSADVGASPELSVAASLRKRELSFIC